MKRPATEYSRLLTGTVVVLLGLLAFILRAIPWRNFLGRSGEYLFYGPDSYDHLRRITLGLTTFPAVPAFDSYYGFPVGTGQIWSPLFDYLVTLLALLCGADAAQPGVMQAIGFWLSPLLAAVTVVQVYLVAKLVADRGAALVAALVAAILPGHLLYTFVSELDHHVAEPMVCLGLFHAVLKGSARVRQGRGGWQTALPAALWLLLAILIWRGSVIFWGVALLALLVQSVADQLAGRSAAGHAGYARNVAALTGAALVPICLFNVWGSAGGMNFGIVSWFHVGLLAAAALLFAILAHGAWDRCRLLKVVALAAGGGGVMVLLVPAGRRFLLELLSGLAVIGGTDPWLDSISELRPMLFPDGTLHLWHATEMLSLLYWLFPLLLYLVARSWQAGGRAEFCQALFLVWGGLFWLLPLFRERYLHLTAIVLAVGAGLLARQMAMLLPLRGERARLAGMVAMLVVCLLPCVPFLWRLPAIGLVDAERDDLPAALGWLKSNTPKTSAYLAPVTMPEYGVLTEWGLGAYVCYGAERPTVATNFGWETHGLYESTSFLVQTDPELAARILDDNRVRYLLLNDVTEKLPLFRAIAEQGVAKKKALPLGQFVPLATMYYRLYLQDGAAYGVQEVEATALGRYRLVYESMGQMPEPLQGLVSHYKIFEYVPGAVLAGKTVPNATVTVELPLKSGIGRQFAYRDRIVADGAGNFTLRLPYATTEAAGETMPLGPYLVMSNGRTTRVAVRPEEVALGRRLQD